MVNVGLNNVGVRQGASRRVSCFNCRTQIDGDNLACSPTRREQRVTPFTAATFEHHLVAKKLRLHGRKPAEKLLRVMLVGLREMLPLPPEALGSRAFVTLDFREIREPRYTASDRKRPRAPRTAQLALHDLFRFRLRDGEIERPFTR